ncbi:hypothetical protein EVAR_43564_1 [Eumeta japonica]|uniref:Uncharacterized protein n=1 Tax=Eumeta variegata TaxID=151549 RepID=A0A4C1XHE0_EUMVA|nr:hypothetical protein EVAR_43564_1 [Eumeta japonica]
MGSPRARCGRARQRLLFIMSVQAHKSCGFSSGWSDLERLLIYQLWSHQFPWELSAGPGSRARSESETLSESRVRYFDIESETVEIEHEVAIVNASLNGLCPALEELSVCEGARAVRARHVPCGRARVRGAGMKLWRSLKDSMGRADGRHQQAAPWGAPFELDVQLKRSALGARRKSCCGGVDTRALPPRTTTSFVDILAFIALPNV